MAAPIPSLFVFADQTVDSASYLTDLSYNPTHSKILRELFQSITLSLQAQIKRLSQCERTFFGKFDSVLDLALHDGKERNIVVATVLHCVAQLASLMMFVSSS